MTGDGIGVNTFFRDREFAWPVRSLPIPVALFTHADPFAWDEPGGPTPPRDYGLTPPSPGGVRSSTEDIQHFTRMARSIAMGSFPEGRDSIVDSAEFLSTNLKKLKPAFFDDDGNRHSGTGEHVVVLRPSNPVDVLGGRRTHTDAVLEVYVRQGEHRKWTLLHSRPLTRPNGGRQE
jgi:hypothetical protein